MTNVLFSPSSAADEYKKAREHQSLKLAVECLETLNSEGYCNIWLKMRQQDEARSAVKLLTERGWDASTPMRNRMVRFGDSTVRELQINLCAQTPARARMTLQCSRAALDATLQANAAHWLCCWRLRRWVDDQTGYYSTNLDPYLLVQAQQAYRKRDFAKANQLFNDAFAKREAVLVDLEAKSKVV